MTTKQTNIFEFLDEGKTKPNENKPFTYASLFSGIGGMESGLDPLGGECVFASEFDKFAKQSYTALYGDEHLHGDITKIEAKDVPDHDVLVGGFPCQAFSVAGKRGGFEDARGTLFFDMARIASEKQPKVILAENVKGLVGHDKGKTLDTIVKTLNEIGYRVDFEVLNSKYFDVPQNRERIFIVAIREDLVENEAWTNVKGNTIVPKGKRRISGYEDVKTFNFEFPKNDTVNKRLVDVLEDEVDEKYYLSEEKTAQLTLNIKEDSEDSPDKIGGLYGKSQAGSIWDNRNISPTLKTTTGGYSEPLIPEPRVDVVGNSSETGHGGEDVYSSEGLSPTLLSRDYKGAKQIAEGLPIKEATKKGYTVAEPGDSVNISFPDSETRRGRVGKQTANTLLTGEEQGIVLGVGHHPLSKKREFNGYGDLSPTLIATDYKAPKTALMSDFRIRKLTPLECWRLQGFTDEQHNAVEASGISNSQRYRQAGNAVTVNVIKAIGERLLPYL